MAKELRLAVANDSEAHLATVARSKVLLEEALWCILLRTLVSFLCRLLKLIRKFCCRQCIA